jgi:hypothetical protein
MNKRRTMVASASGLLFSITCEEMIDAIEPQNKLETVLVRTSKLFSFYSSLEQPLVEAFGGVSIVSVQNRKFVVPNTP